MASVITIAFEGWKAQEAASGKPVLLNEFVFANVPNLDPTKPIDRNEKLPPANQIVCRQAVNKAGLASENAVAYSVTLGADVGDFDFNWIGLLNKESGTVAMITHAPLQKKLKTQNGQQGNVLIRSFLLEFQGAAVETQIKTSAETWQIDFTARLAGIDEMQRLINFDSYGAAAFFNDGFEVTRSGEQYTVKKGLGYVGGLRGELAQNQILNGLRNVKIYADFSYQGNIVSQWNTVVKITSAATLNNYVDAAGFTHQVFAIASIDESGNVKDLRPMGGLSSQEINALENRFKLDLSKKIDKANITSQTGNSTELVASQQLVTTEAGKKASKEELNNGLALKFDKTGGLISGDIDLNNGTSKEPSKIKTWGSGARESVFEVNIGKDWVLHIDKLTNGTVETSFKGKIIPGDFSNFDSRYTQKAEFNLELNKKVDKANISSALGNNNDKVPSLSLLTTELGKKQPAGNYQHAGDYATKEDVANAISAIPQNSMFSNNNGWFKDANTGMIIQWGRVIKSGKGITNILFPIPFPRACVNVQVSINTTGVAENNYSSVKSIRLDGAEIGYDQNGSWWMALGW